MPAAVVVGDGEPEVGGAGRREGQGWLRRLWSYMLRHRRSVQISLAAALLGSGCQVLVPLVARQIVDKVIIARSSPVLPWLALLIGLSGAVFGFAFLRRYRGGQVAIRVQNDLRNDMHDHLQAMDFTRLDRLSTGQVVSRANSDSALVQGLLNMLPIMSGNVIQLVLSLVVMFLLSPLLALVSLVITPALVIIAYRMRSRIFPATWDAQQKEGDVAQIVDEDVSGVRVVKAFGRERREIERIADVSVAVYGAQMRAVRLQATYQPLLQAVPTLGQVAVLGFGGWLALDHRLSIGTFLAFSAYVAQLMAPARQLAAILAIGQQARVGIERIFQLLDTAPAIVDPPDAVDLPTAPTTSTTGNAPNVPHGLDGVQSPAPGAGGEITFDGVRFGYAGTEQWALDGVDLRIAPGERVALVGPSGSGKSTLAALISRFYDVEAGSVAVNGLDVRHLRLASLRHAIGVVFEDSFLFSDSVRANIAYGRPEAGEEQIVAAAGLAQADEFVRALPRGYDTVVGERGLSLSGGQRQRIALARAILADPEILILDDATSAVDATTEQAIHEGLRTVMAGRTVLLIAHRESTLHLADRVVVLRAGRVAEQGPHEQLLARSPSYRALVSGPAPGDPGANGSNGVGGVNGVGEELSAPWPVAPSRRRASAPIGSPGSPGWSAAVGGSGSVGGTAPGLGSGLGGSAGGGASRALGGLAPTPELLARVAALPPVRDFPTLDLAAESRPDPHFSLRRLLRDFRGQLLLGLLLVVLDALAGLLGPYLVKTGVDGGVEKGSAMTLLVASLVFLLVTAGDLVDEIAETFVSGRIAQRVMLSLRIRIFAQLQRLSLDYYEREMAGRIMTRMTTDVDAFESLIENGLLSAFVSGVTFVGVALALLLVNWQLGLATLTVVIPLSLATLAFRRRSAVYYNQARERIAIVNADFQESLSGVREAQAFVHEAATRARFHGLGERYLESRVSAQKLVATYFPFVQFLSGVADAIVLGLGAYLIPRGDLTSGALIAFILYIDMFFSPIQQLSQVFDSWQQTRVSVARISDLMALQTVTPAAEHPLAVGRIDGALSLDAVRFSYPTPTERPGPAAERLGPSDARLILAADAALGPPPEALRSIDFAVRPGETVALVGETGAGKSTVMKLVARFYDPDSGAVRVDGANVRDLDLGAFRRRLGYVPQEAFLFTGTVRDNIAYGRPEAGDAEVEAAARAVGAHEFVLGLPGGYGHQISERGRSLSAGHRQLIALARAELVDPAILLLDEATSNLDLVTEAHVTAAMRTLARGRTTLVIAHRLQTARSADRIAVLHAGRIVETGSHESLLAADGRYAQMWRAFELAETT